MKHLSESSDIHLQYSNRKIQEQSNHIKSLSERFTELESFYKTQQETISRLESKLEESSNNQQTTIERLEASSKDQKLTIWMLKCQLNANSQKLEESQQRNRRFSGILIWGVPNFHKKFQGVKRGKIDLVNICLHWKDIN